MVCLKKKKILYFILAAIQSDRGQESDIVETPSNSPRGGQKIKKLKNESHTPQSLRDSSPNLGEQLEGAISCSTRSFNVGWE